jgi:hypothetical protein
MFIEQAIKDGIYPWYLYWEPSQQDENLSCLCLSHDESEHYLIVETYYDDEMSDALTVAVKALRNNKSKIDISILTRLSDRRRRALISGCMTSRSTQEFKAKLPIGSSVISLLGGRK